MNNYLDHVGILVEDLEQCVEILRSKNCPIGQVELFPAEGTKEVYIGPAGASARLLLIETIGSGPYQKAMIQRGPGLHHIAISVRDFKEFALEISGSGWYVHPKSLISQVENQTIWLARPGIPMLVEVFEGDAIIGANPDIFISKVEVPLPNTHPLLARALGIKDSICPAREANVFLTIGGLRLALTAWLGEV